MKIVLGGLLLMSFNVLAFTDGGQQQDMQQREDIQRRESLSSTSDIVKVRVTKTSGYFEDKVISHDNGVCTVIVKFPSNYAGSSQIYSQKCRLDGNSVTLSGEKFDKKTCQENEVAQGQVQARQVHCMPSTDLSCKLHYFFQNMANKLPSRSYKHKLKFANIYQESDLNDQQTIDVSILNEQEKQDFLEEANCN